MFERGVTTAFERGWNNSAQVFQLEQLLDDSSSEVDLLFANLAMHQLNLQSEQDWNFSC